MRRTAQASLDLGRPMPSEQALRAAYDQVNLRKPFQQAIADPALAICLRNLAAVDTRRAKHGRRR